MKKHIDIFDRKLKQIHRDRSVNLLADHDFLISECYRRVEEVFGNEIVQKFHTALEIGCRTGGFSAGIKKSSGIETLFQSDLSVKMLEKSDGIRLAIDEEHFPFASESFDFIFSILNLHWVNNIQSCFTQLHNLLKEDGMFIGVMFAPETLYELRETITKCEISEIGGMTPRISPFIDIKDGGVLLNKAGFALPVVHKDIIKVAYSNVFDLIHDIRGMGESNALLERRPLNRGVAKIIDKKYKELFQDSSGNITATFELITFTGWK